MAAMFGTAGVMKSSQPIEKLDKAAPWTRRFPEKAISVIGMLEMFGALGLIIPCALNIVPSLTPLAASGLALIQVFAIYHHAKYREVRAIAFNALLLAAAVFIAVGRF